jgi:2'-5' RNA ligase
VRSIEIVFDDAADRAFRARWQALADVGLPSLALHTSSSNRPHITLAAGQMLRAQRPDVAVPPMVRFGGVMLFPAHNDRWVLVDAVVLDEGLATFHRALHTRTAGAVATSLPDRWSPHVTIARRLTAERVAAALVALQSVPTPETATVASVRLWDGETKQITPFASASRLGAKPQQSGGAPPLPTAPAGPPASDQSDAG